MTAEFVDLQARLRGLQDTRNQYVTLLTRANSIQDILAVQDRMNTLQIEIEQLQGQQKLLDDKSTYATLTITIGDESASQPAAEPRKGFAKALHDAGEGFTHAVQRVVAGSGIVAFWMVVILLAGAGAAVVRGLLRRRQVAVEVPVPSEPSPAG